MKVFYYVHWKTEKVNGQSKEGSFNVDIEPELTTSEQHKEFTDKMIANAKRQSGQEKTIITSISRL